MKNLGKSVKQAVKCGNDNDEKCADLATKMLVAAGGFEPPAKGL